MGFFSPDLCEICQSPLKRVRERVRVNGREVVACANCARELAEHKSKMAVKGLVTGTTQIPEPARKRRPGQLPGCFVVAVFAVFAAVVWLIWRSG